MAKASAAQKRAKPVTPRYMQLAAELREEIVDGRYQNSNFPTETTLTERFGVSRFTVREALRRLQNEGLIARKRGSGTIVQPAAARGGALHQPMSNVGELLQYARESAVTYEPRECGPLPPEIAVQLDGDLSGDWNCFRGVRRHDADALPIAVTDAYFHERLANVVDELDLGAGTLFSQIERLSGISVGTVTQDIQAIAADRATADALEIERGDPVLRILRCYLDPQGDIFEISVGHHPGDRFAYSMHIDIDS